MLMLITITTIFVMWTGCKDKKRIHASDAAEKETRRGPILSTGSCYKDPSTTGNLVLQMNVWLCPVHTLLLVHQVQASQCFLACVLAMPLQRWLFGIACLSAFIGRHRRTAREASQQCISRYWYMVCFIYDTHISPCITCLSIYTTYLYTYIHFYIYMHTYIHIQKITCYM